jgi:hypothetical protein
MSTVHTSARLAESFARLRERFFFQRGARSPRVWPQSGPGFIERLVNKRKNPETCDLNDISILVRFRRIFIATKNLLFFKQQQQFYHFLFFVFK